MPIARVQLPDGRTARFEVAEGTTPEQVMAFAEQQFKPPEPTEYSMPADSMAGKIASTLDKVEATPYIGPVVKGVRDVTKGGAQLLAHGINAVAPSILSDADLRGVDNDVRVSERNYQQARQAREPQSITSLVTGERKAPGIDWGRIAGSALATYPLIPIKAASIPSTIAKGAAAGGGVGALSPVLSGDESFASQKAKQIALGAASGGVASGIGAGLSRVVRPKTSPDVKQLIDQGVTPTPGQALGGWMARSEEKMTSLPVIGDSIIAAQRRGIEDFNRAAYNRALEPIGKTAGKEVGREAVRNVKTALRDAYEELLPKLQFKADKQFSDEIGRLMTLAESMPPEQANMFQKIVRDQVVGKMTPQGNMSGESLKIVESELSRLARGYRGDPAFDNRQLGTALDEMLRAIRSGLERSNPDYAKPLSQINKGYSNYTVIRDAAGRVGAEDGIFTPAQLQSAVRAADKSVGKGNFATGGAKLQDLSEAGKKVLGKKYPDSGTAGRLMAATNPLWYLSLGAGALPYTTIGQKTLAAILTKRPDAAEPIARGLLSSSPMLGAATAGGLLSLYGPSGP